MTHILHAGRTHRVVAKVRSNGIDCVAIMAAPGRPVLVPVAKMVVAPERSKPVLVCVEGERV